MKIESRNGTIPASDERVYALLSDFSRLGQFVQNEQVKDFKSDADSCSFNVDKMGYFGMRIIEREPFKLVKITSDGQMPFSFNLWIQLKPAAANQTHVKVTLDANLNPIFAMVAKGPLTTFVETLIDRLETIR